MNRKLVAGTGILFLVVVSCTLSPAGTQPPPPTVLPNAAVATSPAPGLPNSAAFTATPRDTLPPYPTSAPTETPTPTLDPCTAYVTSATAISAQFEMDLVKVKADLASHDLDSLSWDWSQILNFAISKVEALQPPAQFAGFNQSFLAELHAYDDGALAYLQADPVTGAAKFAEGDALRGAQAEPLSLLSCSK